MYDIDSEEYITQVKRLCEAAKECDIPLEINLLGLFENRWYPNDVFWKIVGEVGNKVVFGLDAHSAERAFDDYSLQKANDLVEKYNLNLVNEIKLKRL